ncbi:PAS domain-containing protein [Actinacidiphila sp. SB3-2]
MHDVLRATSGSQLFQMTAAPYVVLDTDLRIQGVNPAYLRATGRSHDELLEMFMFDAFPDNPEDEKADGVRNLGASLEQVLRHGAPHNMGVQRYDIPDVENPGTFRLKTWSPLNSPLLDGDGRVVGALHHVEDVTAVHDLLHGAGTDGDGQPPAAVHHAMLALARYERAADALTAPPAVPVHAPASAHARRDALWHRIVHAVREDRNAGCADAVCGAAVAELPVDGAAITLHGSALHRGSRMPHQLGASSRLAQRAEELQWVVGEGPSLTAFDTGEAVPAADLDRAGAAWPLFTDAAQRIGLSAVFAFPLRTAASMLGTLTLYRARSAEQQPQEPPADGTLSVCAETVLSPAPKAPAARARWPVRPRPGACPSAWPRAGSARGGRSPRGGSAAGAVPRRARTRRASAARPATAGCAYP